jgi:hypothetical protein
VWKRTPLLKNNSQTQEKTMSDKPAATKVQESQPEEIQALNPMEDTQELTTADLIYQLLQEHTSKIDGLPEEIEGRVKNLVTTTKEGKSDQYLLLEKIGGLTQQSMDIQQQQMALLEGLDQKVNQLIASKELPMPSSKPDSSES